MELLIAFLFGYLICFITILAHSKITNVMEENKRKAYVKFVNSNNNKSRSMNTKIKFNNLWS